MPVYNEIYVYIVSSTIQLVLYSIVYQHIIYYKGEYMAMMKAMEEAIWLQGLLHDFGID